MFIIKKNPHATGNPWLGNIPSMSPEDLFGKVVQILEHGGSLRSFASAAAGYEHIRKHYPEDIGVMQVYEVVESPSGLEFRHVPE